MNYKDFVFKKKYGQNFLIDNNVLNNIIKVADIKDNSLVIEIGCGSGNLTKYLCNNASYVLGYEIDESTKELFNENLNELNNYNIIYDDFLKRDIKKDLESFKYENLYIIANLPYYITTPIIEKIVESNIEVKKMVVMVQKEVGERFSALVGTKEYSSITVYLNYYFDVKKEFIVSRNCFIPKPNVDSLIISFSSKSKKIQVKDYNLLFKLIKDSFQFKRKNLKNNLKNYNLDIVLKVLSKYGFDLSVRAEQLKLEIFCDIANELSI